MLGDFNQLPDSQLRNYPLKQIVTGPTRGQALLDKIYTNISNWFDSPVVLPAVIKSDHDSVLLSTICFSGKTKAANASRLSQVFRSQQKKHYSLKTCDTLIGHRYFILTAVNQWLIIFTRLFCQC